MPATDLTVDALKRLVDVTMGTDDDLLGRVLGAAIDQAQAPPPYGTGRRIARTPEEASDEAVTLLLPVTGRGSVEAVDARDAIAVATVDGAPVTGYVAHARDGLIHRLTDVAATGSVRVTGRFGFLPTPPALAEGIYVLAARMFYEREAHYSDQVVVGEGAAAESYYRQLPQRTSLAFRTFAARNQNVGAM